MPLPSRPSLLLAVLLATTSTAALAAPQQHGHGRKPPPQARAQAQQDDREDARGPRARRGDDALSDSIRRVERNTRGKVLSAEQVPYDGRSLNRIKIVDERGRVRVYMDDPQAPAPPDRGTPTRGDDD